MKNLMILVIGLSLWLAPELSFAKDCKKGKPCGEACIPKDKICKTDTTVAKKVCKKGKPCGNTCIAIDKKCSTDNK